VIPAAHARAIRQATGAEPLSVTPVRGGDIARAFRIELSDGGTIFYKTAPGGMFPAEAAGLAALAEPGVIRVPRVVAVARDFLALEHIPPGPPGPAFFPRFGRQLARLHRHRATHYGFSTDNFIGASPQPNPRAPEGPGAWGAWYWGQRLHFQLTLATRGGLASGSLTRAVSRLETRLPALLAGSDEAPSLLHGDLWAGNFLVDPAGEPVLIDPAVYYGHREADLAMTLLFGGFPAPFYEAYQQEWPLPPGWRDRVPLYQLYHVLNHLNLFGGGYAHQALQLAERCLR
jgi:protein-ribulosamine 3-kinase